MFDDSIEKILGQLELLSKGYIISPTFYRGFRCQQCGWCCRLSFTKDYLPQEFEIFRGVYPKEALKFKKRIIRWGGLKTIYTFREIGKWCSFLEGGKTCTIHRFNPLSCALEPIKVWKIRGKTYLMKRPYGRGWMDREGLGKAECVFLNDFFDDNKAIIKRLREWGKYFNYNF